jgi:hypothetical protein
MPDVVAGGGFLPVNRVDAERAARGAVDVAAKAASWALFFRKRRLE